MKKLELWLFKKLIRRKIHQGSVPEIYKIVYEVSLKEYNKEKSYTIQNYLTECFHKSFWK
jgi:hypothetical protein